MAVISVLNPKGGSGKTTLTTNLAQALHLRVSKVLIVDSDPQGSARDWHAASEANPLPLVSLDRANNIKTLSSMVGSYDHIVLDGAAKMEDIINRGGGDLAVKVYNSTADEQLADTDVTLSLDGVSRKVPAGDTLTLTPGESITINPNCYHEFWGVGDRVLVGEVSKVNDDATDNRFHGPVGRFPDIEEDEAPLHLLVNDYERYYGTS